MEAEAELSMARAARPTKSPMSKEMVYLHALIGIVVARLSMGRAILRVPSSAVDGVELTRLHAEPHSRSRKRMTYARPSSPTYSIVSSPSSTVASASPSSCE